MAWLTQKKRGGNFLIQFRFQGRKFTRSLKTTSESKAKAQLAALEETIRLVDAGRIVIPGECTDLPGLLLNDGQSTVPRRPQKRVTLGQAFELYLENLPTNSFEPSTLRITGFRMNVLRRIIGSSTLLASINKSKLQDFVNRRSQETGRHGKPIHPSTIKSDLRVLSVVWTFAQDEDLVDFPFPGRRLRLPKAAGKLPFQTKHEIERYLSTGTHSPQERKEVWQRAYLTIEDTDELLDFVRDKAEYPFIYPMFVMAAHTGARRSELIRSQREDVLLAERVMTIREKKRVRGRESIRTVPLSARLYESLSEWFVEHPGGSLTFQAAERLGKSSKVRGIGDGITPDEAHNHFKSTLANSTWSELPGWHCLRHSFISNCAAKGIDSRTIMSMVGHMTEEMQERYRHVVPAQMQRELRQVFG